MPGNAFKLGTQYTETLLEHLTTAELENILANYERTGFSREYVVTPPNVEDMIDAGEVLAPGEKPGCL